MVLNIYKIKGIVYYYYYNELTEKPSNASAPNGYYATDVGYMGKAEAKTRNVKIYHALNTSFGCTNEKVDELIVRLKPMKIVFLSGEDMFNYYNYLVNGDQFDGLKKTDVADGFDYTIEDITFRAPGVADADILNELTTLYNTTGEVFHKDMGAKYWHPKRSKNNNFIGNTVVRFPTMKNVYLGVSIKDDGEIGKGIRDLNYTLVKGDTSSNLSDAFSILEEENKIVPLIVNVIDLNSELVVRALNLYDGLIKHKTFGLSTFNAISGITVGKIYTPPNLMFIVGEEIDILYKTISSMTPLDITELIYDDKYKPTEDVEKGNIWVKHGKHRMKLFMGVDTVTRNMFASYSKSKPKVELLVKEYPKILKYYTRITYDDIEIISYAPQNSIKLLK